MTLSSDQLDPFEESRAKKVTTPLETGHVSM